MAVKPVLLIRAAGNESDQHALKQVGVESIIDPYLKIAPAKDPAGAFELLAELKSAKEPTWVIATSANSLRYWAHIVGVEKLKSAFSAERKIRFAAIGSKTAQLFREYGAAEVLQPNLSTGKSLLDELLQMPKAHAVMPIGNLTLGLVQEGLIAGGWKVTARIVYTHESVDAVPESVSGVDKGEFAAVILRSPSAVRAFLQFVPNPKLPLICGGMSAALELQKAGLTATAIFEDPDPTALAKLTHTIVRGGSQ